MCDNLTILFIIIPLIIICLIAFFLTSIKEKKKVKKEFKIIKEVDYEYVDLDFVSNYIKSHLILTDARNKYYYNVWYGREQYKTYTNIIKLYKEQVYNISENLAKYILNRLNDPYILVDYIMSNEGFYLYTIKIKNDVLKIIKLEYLLYKTFNNKILRLSDIHIIDKQLDLIPKDLEKEFKNLIFHIKYRWWY